MEYELNKNDAGGVSVSNPEGLVYHITYAADQYPGQIKDLIDDVNKRLEN